MSTTLSVRVEPEVKARLDALADATQRSRSFLAAEAIREYVEINEWQLQEIQNAVAEADAGDFASDDELASLARKWRVDAGA
jgi:predicted transcriptional regulator